MSPHHLCRSPSARHRPASLARPLRLPAKPSSVFQLLLMAVALSLAGPVEAKGYNRLTQFKVTGGATLTVTIAPKGKPQQRPVLRVPSAKIELQCRRSGYRPNQIIYGVAPLNHAVKLGRARAQSFPSARLRRSTKRAVFPIFSFRERGPKSRRVLANLEAAAWKKCTTGAGATNRKLNLAVAVRCKRVKGFGARWARLGAKAVVPLRIVCKPASRPAARKPGRPGRIGRPRRR